MNKLDLDYQNLLKDILENGIKKETRNGGTLSLFGKQIRHKMSEGFPLLTTKKMPFKLIATELMWFLRGDTNIKFLVDNDCHIWDGDAYKRYHTVMNSDEWIENWVEPGEEQDDARNNKGNNGYTKEEFIHEIKTDDEFAKNWGELGPVYGKQWRNWNGRKTDGFVEYESNGYNENIKGIDQIANLINDLKTNPDSRRLMVTAWNPSDLELSVLPPCHYGFQVYTRELSLEERLNLGTVDIDMDIDEAIKRDDRSIIKKYLDYTNTPTRAISLIWNQRSVDTFLGLPFNIASYGLLLEIIAKAVNMVPDELIGNLGDTHLYSNHIEQAKEQIGRELSREERYDLMPSITGHSEENISNRKKINNFEGNIPETSYHEEWLDSFNIPTRTRQPYPLPTLNINTEFWPTESGECGEGPIDAQAVFNNFTDEHFCKCLLEEDLQLSNYQSHPHIKAPLSN
jgi:thymidylate synthase